MPVPSTVSRSAGSKPSTAGRSTSTAPLEHDHPEIGNPFGDDVYTAEVLNLTRNVRIEGTGNHTPSFQPHQNGRAHVIFLATEQPQTVKYIELGHLGPRRADKKFTEGVKGRYPLHFHHAKDGSRGSLIEGVVARQSGNRAFVPHASHGNHAQGDHRL